MSARASWGVWCDYCDDLLSGGDLGCETAKEARDNARHHGARRSLGKDICEDCWANGKRGASDRTEP